MKGENPPNQPTIPKWLDLPPIQHALAESEIHLWLIHLQAPTETLTTCAAVLSADETARAARFRFPHLRAHYTIARGAVRQLLASYLNTIPEALRFQYTPEGKPSLTNEAHVTFNISHSQNLALLAITTHHRIGIDLEYREPKRDLDQIATHNFSSREAAALFSLPEDQRTGAFYACWTLKEAYLKATGDGLSTPLDSFEVRFPPIAPARLASIASSPDEHLRWQAYSFVVENHAAALITEGQHHSIHRGVWNSQTGHAP